MDKKTIVVLIGLILIIDGMIAIVYAEPAGDEGSEESRGIADISEDVSPYF
ncbi:MAG: hypothetical protein ACOC8Y_02950 [Candidatus Natronoplasma sp.]